MIRRAATLRGAHATRVQVLATFAKIIIDLSRAEKFAREEGVVSCLALIPAVEFAGRGGEPGFGIK